MQNADGHVTEVIAHDLFIRRDACRVAFALFDKRADDVRLSSLVDVLFDVPERAAALWRVDEIRFDGLTSRGKLV